MRLLRSQSYIYIRYKKIIATNIKINYTIVGNNRSRGYMNSEYESLSLLKYLKSDIDVDALDYKNPEVISLMNDVLQGVKGRDRDVVLKRFLIEPPITLREIGGQLNISRERVRQLESRALKRITYNYRKKGIKERLEQFLVVQSGII